MSSKAFLGYSIQLFALLANRFPLLIYGNVRDFIRNILLREFSPQVVEQHMQTFQGLYQQYSQTRVMAEGDRQIREILWETIAKINRDISKRNKFHMLIRLMLFERLLLQYLNGDEDAGEFENILIRLAGDFHINENEFDNCRNFIAGRLYNIKDKGSLLILGPKKSAGLRIEYQQIPQMKGQIIFLYIKSIRLIAFYHHGNDILYLNDRNLYADHIYVFQRGFSIHGPSLESISYNQVLRRFCSVNEYKINIEVNDLEYRFKGSNRGIHTLSLKMQSGEMIGMIGRSGTGKSTLLNLLNGSLVPLKGEIRINTYDIQKDKYSLNGLIGFVPQDDLLVEELSVFRNLYINAQLCFSNLSAGALTEKVNNLLMEMNLYDVQDLKVGNPLNKFISGGQRKKLNIALELIREPWILYADEPTSGLSSTDSEEIMNFLSDQALSGRVVMVNVHQPSSDIFKLFDRIIVMDVEGYPVYFGDPAGAITYFNDENGKELSLADSCNTCGNLNPESIFRALEEKQIDEFGELTSQRKTSPEQWHQRFLSTIHNTGSEQVKLLPPSQLHQPNAISQFMIFSFRNFLTKIANRSYVIIALGISPVLALILALLCRSGSEENRNLYSFGANDNIPAFLFMSVIVALFIGLIISAEEIIRDRKILLRESFLRLSKVSYLHSKIVYLFALSAVQTFLYVIISNHILGMENMVWRFWLILFSTSCLANMMGLVISSLFHSVVVIYVMVPLLIVPQILLSGVVVNFEKLNENVTSRHYVPFVGDLMASRWSYEAMLISQFRYNDFERNFYGIEKPLSNYEFDYLFVIPEIKNKLQDRHIRTDSLEMEQSRFILNEMHVLNSHYPQHAVPLIRQSKLPADERLRLEKHLDRLSMLLSKKISYLTTKKDSMVHIISKNEGGTQAYLDFKNRNYNHKLSELMLNRQSLVPYVMSGNEMVRKIEPVFEISASLWGRAPFLAADKRIGNATIPTTWFNIAVLWLMLSVMYLFLILTNRKVRMHYPRLFILRNK